MGSIEVFDRQLRLDWWDQSRLKRTSIFLIADNPYAYIGVISAVAVGFGKIYVIGSRYVKNFMILFDRYTGNFSRGVVEFVERHLWKFLENYGMELEAVPINLASSSALRLVEHLMRIDDSEKKIIFDLSTDLHVKLFVWKLMKYTKSTTYMALLSEGVKLYALSDLVLGEDRAFKLSSQKPAVIIRDIYSRLQKQKASKIPIEHLFLLASGLSLGEIALRVNEKLSAEGGEERTFVPTKELEFPFEGAPRLRGGTLNLRKVVVVGVGALGTFYAIQLALMINLGLLRVKEIVFVDPDTIELTNFNRQVLYWGDTIGLPKAEVMAERFQRMVNGSVIAKYEEARFEDVEDRMRDATLIIEGVDTWAARKNIARFALKYKRPLISAGVTLLSGQETFYLPFKTYCPFHSINLAKKEDPPVDESCLNITPSVIFTNMTIASLAVLTSIGAKNPLNGVLYYSLEGYYKTYKRFYLEKYDRPCGD